MTGHAMRDRAAAIAEARRICAEDGVDVSHLSDEQLIDLAGSQAYRATMFPLTRHLIEERLGDEE